MEIDRLFIRRSALRIGDSPGDHAAAFDFDFEIFDFLALGDIERPTAPSHTVISGRDIALREREDRITSGGDASESELPCSSVPARSALDGLERCGCNVTVTPRAGSPFNVTRPETVAVPVFVSAG